MKGSPSVEDRNLELESSKGKVKIAAFLCKWCSYAGADLAGGSRRKYPADVRIIRTPCSARINPLFVWKCLEKGLDGVLVSGCHPGECHYTEGNYRTRRNFAVFRKLLEYIGIEPERFHMSWVSAAEGDKWAEVAKEVVKTVRWIGPNRYFSRAKKNYG
jgi:coenzyme F420-reducing hydrogenase delta subunit